MTRRFVVGALVVALVALMPLAASAQPKGKGKGKGKGSDRGPEAGSVEQLQRDVARLRDQLRQAEERLQRARDAEKSRRPDFKGKGRPGERRPDFKGKGRPGFGRGMPPFGRPGEKGPPGRGPGAGRQSDVERKLDAIQRQIDELRRELRRR